MLAFIYIRDSIVVSIPACHAGDRGSIPRLGVFFNSLRKIKTKSKKIIVPRWIRTTNLSVNSRTR